MSSSRSVSFLSNSEMQERASRLLDGGAFTVETSSMSATRNKPPPPLPRVRSNNSSSFSVGTATNSRVTSAESISSKLSMNDSSSEANADLSSKKPLGRRVSKDIFQESGYVPSSLVASKSNSRPASPPPAIANNRKVPSPDTVARTGSLQAQEITRPPSLSSFSPPQTPPTESFRPDSGLSKSTSNSQTPFNSSAINSSAASARFPSRRQSNGTMTPPDHALPRSSPSPIDTPAPPTAPMRPVAPPSRDGPPRARSGRPNRVAPRSPSGGEAMAEVLTLSASPDTHRAAKSLDELFPDDISSTDYPQNISRFEQSQPSSAADDSADPFDERLLSMPAQGHQTHSPREARIRNPPAVPTNAAQGRSAIDILNCETVSSPRTLGLPRSPRDDVEDRDLAEKVNAQRSLVDRILQQSRQQQSQEEELSRYLESLRSRVVEDGIDMLDDMAEEGDANLGANEQDTILEAVSVLKQERQPEEERKTEFHELSSRPPANSLPSPSAENQALEEVARLDKLIQEEFVRSASVMGRASATPPPPMPTALVPITDKKVASPTQLIEEYEPIEAEITVGEGFTPEQEDLTKLLDIDRRLRELESSVSSSSPAKASSILPLSRIESFASRASQKEKLSSLPLLWSTARKSEKEEVPAIQPPESTGQLTKPNESSQSRVAPSPSPPPMEASPSIDGYSRYQQLRDSWRKAESEHDQKMKARRKKMDKERDSALETSAASLRSRMNQFQGDIQGLEDALDETIIEGEEESADGVKSVEEKKGATAASSSPRNLSTPPQTANKPREVVDSDGEDSQDQDAEQDEQEEEEDPTYHVHPRYAVRDDVSELYDEEDQSIDADAVSDGDEDDEKDVENK